MNARFVLAVALTVVVGSTSAQTGQVDEALRQELLKRVKDDQDVRMQVVDWMKSKNLSDPNAVKQMESPLIKKLTDIDRANTEWLKGAVAKHGWPSKSLVGEDGAHAAWLLVQHADLDREFQKKALELMRVLAPKGEVSKSDLAYLTDRVLVAEGKKQLYGTQFRNENGQMVAAPIEDEPNVDKRRIVNGLPTMTEYRRLMEKMFASKGPSKEPAKEPVKKP